MTKGSLCRLILAMLEHLTSEEWEVRPDKEGMAYMYIRKRP